MLKPLFLCTLGLIISLNSVALDIGARVQRTFAHFDLNQDKVITRAESEQARAKRFKKRDTNADNQLSYAEFVAPLKAHYKAKRTRQFKKKDRNHDGLLTREDIKPNRRLFKRFDKNQDNSVSLQEMRDNGMPEKRIQHFVSKVDHDQNQAITQKELIDFYWKNIGRFDNNQDGNVTSAEWLKPNHKEKQKRKKRNQYFQNLDKNADGKISLTEFTRHQPLFKKADKNRDNRLTVEEIKAVLQKKANKRTKK